MNLILIYFILFFGSVVGMTSLRELDISRCSKVNDLSIGHIVSISTLEKLYISETGISSNGVELLASLKNLSVLDLGGLPVTDLVLSSLQVLQFSQVCTFYFYEVAELYL